MNRSILSLLFLSRLRLIFIFRHLIVLCLGLKVVDAGRGEHIYQNFSINPRGIARQISHDRESHGKTCRGTT